MASWPPNAPLLLTLANPDLKKCVFFKLTKVINLMSSFSDKVDLNLWYTDYIASLKAKLLLNPNDTLIILYRFV